MPRTIKKNSAENTKKISEENFFQAPTVQENQVKPSKKIWKKILVAIVALVILGSSTSAIYFYRKYKTLPAVEANELVAKIGKFMVLPQNEIPTLATVTNSEKVKDQPFFANTQNGDKVLIYTKAKKAILYRPRENKIIEVMQLTFADNGDKSQQAQQQTPTQETTPTQELVLPAQENPKKINVAVYNGSKTPGLAVKIGDQIAKIEGFTVTQKQNAKDNYQKTLVVDLSGNNADGARKIADAIGGEVGPLPSNETAPNADILVICAN